MRLPILAASAALLTVACTTEGGASLEDRTLSYGCNDIVVVGSVQNGAYEPVKSENDLLGHGWISATVRVREVVRGRDVPPVLTVKYLAHAYMRQDRDFMLVLAHTETGYEITTGQLMSLRPVLPTHCD